LSLRNKRISDSRKNRFAVTTNSVSIAESLPETFVERNPG
jgi:hypothetical protein